MPDLPYRLTLASGSRGRRELLQRAGYTFDVRPADIDEPTEARLGDVRQYVAELAWLKAQRVAGLVADGVVLAADTVGWQHGRVVGKPDDADHARRIIGALQGTTHELCTGVCLWCVPAGWQVTWQEVSVVRMAPMTAADIERYIETRQWVGCSGAYAVQMPDDPLLTVERGTVSNVIGLPIESLAAALDRLKRAGFADTPVAAV